MLTFVVPEAGEEMLVRIGPTREAIVSWNARRLEGAIDLRFNARDGRTSAWLPYVRWRARSRQSLEGRDTFVRLDTDVVRADVDLVTIGVRATLPLEALFVSTPDYGAPSPIVALPAVELAVPPFSQYDDAGGDRGWCAPASLAMLLAYRGYASGVAATAREVFDGRYGGTGNWTFNTAFAGLLGFCAAVVHLRDLAHAHAFLADDIPLALSIAWSRGELPGAPLPASRGHLVVLRGIAPDGSALVNDPAQPGVSVGYPRAAFERAWQTHGGIALVVVPAALRETLLARTNV
jgi:hypothetical protein